MFVLSAPWKKESEAEGTLLTAVPPTPEPDADSPADTIKTLSANMSSLIQKIDSLNQANEALRLENDELRTSTNLIETRMTERFRAEFASQQSTQQELAGELNRLMQRLDSMPQGGVAMGQQAALFYDESAYGTQDRWRWVESMESQFGDGDVAFDQATDLPRYTIPQNATLVNSTTMTALVGRVPVENRVTDPLPFKVVTGPDNLAANGLRIDDLEGSIWSGFGVGDWALACVSGTLTSVTFVFADGRIRTIGDNHHGGAQIGWISDEKGVPCISGIRKTNVRSWLLAQLGASATGAAAEALATTNTTLQQNPSGFKEAFVSGNIRDFVLGKSVGGTGSSLAQWLMARASQEFDAIFVPTDQAVAIHVDVPLHIDYEEQGRKLTYDEDAAHDDSLAVD